MADVDIFPYHLEHGKEPLHVKVDVPRTGQKKDLVVLTGYALVRWRGESERTWRRAILNVELKDPRWREVEQVAPLVSLASIFNRGVANFAGWAVDNVWAEPFPVGSDLGIRVKSQVAVRDSDGYLLRVGYHVTIVGEVQG